MPFKDGYKKTIMATIKKEALSELKELIEEEVMQLEEDLGIQGGPGDHSMPGGFPYRQSGKLQASIGSDIDTTAEGLEASVFSQGVSYATFLNEGTEKMEPRPFLDLSADRLDKKIRERFGGEE